MKASYLKHLTSSKDLETTYEAIRAGLVALALEKNRRATPFIEQARSLKVAASQVKGPRDLLESGILENAANLTDDEQIASIANWLCAL